MGIIEEERIKSLYELDLLDTVPEEEFDQLVRLAAEVCSTPISTVSLVDTHRQWFKASVGLISRETPREVSFCSHAIEQTGIFIVEDAALDERFRENSLVTGDPGIRFYAGMPLLAPSGAAIGTLCVIDTRPRELTADQLSALRILGLQVQSRIELRAKQKALEATVRANGELMKCLEQSEALFRTFMDLLPLHAALKSSDGTYLFYNRHFAEQLGIDQQAWLGKTDFDVLPKWLAERFRASDLQVLRQPEPVELYDQLPNAAGEIRRLKGLKFSYVNPHGAPTIASIAIDMTELLTYKEQLEEANRNLTRLSRTDALTGLTNRRVFEERIEIEFQRAKRKLRPLSILILDLDNFKRRNDRYGHAAGDEALRLTGQTLLQTCRLEDLAARIGGEEFAFILPETTADEARCVARRVQDQLRATACGPEPLTASVGIACVNPTIATWDRLVACADDAMYAAKSNGKDQIVVHHEHVAKLLQDLRIKDLCRAPHAALPEIDPLRTPRGALAGETVLPKSLVH